MWKPLPLNIQTVISYGASSLYQEQKLYPFIPETTKQPARDL